MPQICLRGIELRYALTLYLGQHGPQTLSDLIDALTYQGFTFRGRPSKAISDALRWEVSRGRVQRIRRGLCPGFTPSSTEYRIHQRVLGLRQQARGYALPISRWEDADWFHS